MKPPVVAREMYRAATHTTAILCEGSEHRFIGGRFAESVGLERVIVGEYLLSDEGRIENILKFQLIVDKVSFVEIRSLLQDHNLEPGGG